MNFFTRFTDSEQFYEFLWGLDKAGVPFSTKFRSWDPDHPCAFVSLSGVQMYAEDYIDYLQEGRAKMKELTPAALIRYATQCKFSS